MGGAVATLNPIELAAEIVAAFVSNNSLPRAELAAVIETVHAAVKRLAEGAEVAPAVIDAPAPAVSIRKSVTPDYLICLEDGKRFKSLRRHLAKLGMTPEQYRAKWDLPSTYPMVAPVRQTVAPSFFDRAASRRPASALLWGSCGDIASAG